MSAPHLRVVRGDPTPEELAALLAVVTATGAAPAEPERVRHGGWNDPARQLRKPLHPGPAAWRAAAR